jgi:hypothetical protein
MDLVKEKPSTPTDTLLLTSSNDVIPSWLPERADIAQPPISNSLGKNWQIFFQLVSTLFCEVKKGFVDPCKNVL